MADSQLDVHRQVLLLLLERIQSDPYPSVTMMNMVEEMLGPDEVGAYAEVLMDKIDAARFPSIDMLKRVTALA